MREEEQIQYGKDFWDRDVECAEDTGQHQESPLAVHLGGDLVGEMKSGIDNPLTQQKQGLK
jgi:hypothetical protein